MKKSCLLVFATAFTVLVTSGRTPYGRRKAGGMAATNPATLSPAKPDEDLSKSLGVKFSGDAVFRTEYFVQGEDYAPIYDSSTPLWIDHEFRLRVRGRFGVEKDFGEEAFAGLRLSTGNGTDPSDPYLTLTNGTNLKNFNLDRVFIHWTPSFTGRLVTLTAGKMPNPLAYSPITWDEDISPEGAALAFEPGKGTQFTALYTIMEENGPATIEGNGVDLFIANFQFQQEFKFPEADLGLMVGYQYVPYVSAYETGDAGVTTYLSDPTNPPGAPLSVTGKGMVGDLTHGGMIPDMHIVEAMVTVAHKLGAERIPVLWTFHGALNLTSFNITAQTNANAAVNDPALNDTNNLALFAQVKVGEAARNDDFAGSFEWGYIDPNAVFAAFSDSDSGVGHNNNTWFMGKVATGIAEDLSLSVDQYLGWRTDYNVFGTAASNLFGTTSRDPILRTQIDLAAKL